MINGNNITIVTMTCGDNVAFVINGDIVAHKTNATLLPLSPMVTHHWRNCCHCHQW